VVLEHEAIQRELARQARTDPLTGLLNRRSFLDELRRRVDRLDREGQVGTLLYMDLDHFKRLNDTCGHEVGDEALVLAATMLRATVRATDLVARLGGDEFVALAVDAANANAIADRIQQNLSGKFVGEKLQLPIAVSIGMSWIEPGQDVQIEEALATADAAMYTRKRARRDSKPPLAVS
jgi:diguanylate cyclase (GGDEF)-like protein